MFKRYHLAISFELPEIRFSHDKILKNLRFEVESPLLKVDS
jgi:hypothetical protein